MSEPAEVPVTHCDRCGADDDHPKNVVSVGLFVDPWGGPLAHPDDSDRDGTVRYHFDCEHEWQSSIDPRFVDAAQNGTHGDQLRALILGEDK